MQLKPFYSSFPSLCRSDFFFYLFWAVPLILDVWRIVFSGYHSLLVFSLGFLRIPKMSCTVCITVHILCRHMELWEIFCLIFVWSLWRKVRFREPLLSCDYLKAKQNRNFALAGVVARQHRSSASLGMQASEFRERGAEKQAFFFCQTSCADVSRAQTFSFLTCGAMGRVKVGVGLEFRTRASKFSLGVWEKPACCECRQEPSPGRGLQTIKTLLFQFYPDCNTTPDPDLMVDSLVDDGISIKITHVSWASSFSTGRFLHISFPWIIF